MPNGSFADRVQRWDVLVKSLTANAPDLPTIADDLKQLQDVLQRTREMRQQQDVSQAQLRSDVKLRQALDQQGEGLRSRIMLSLKAKYGVDAGKLYEFGMRPVKARRSKAPPAGPGPNPPAAPAPIHPAVQTADPHPSGPAAEPLTK